jgi:nicotinate-nucleotide adenylyltransferase
MRVCEFSRSRSPRIGLFGGTFNPIHRGHVQVATDVLHALRLDYIYFIPCALPPHKSAVKLAPAQDRLNMVRLALDGHDRLGSCDSEIERTGPSYSIDTVRQFRAATSEHIEMFFILGVDAFLEIHTWKDFEGLFEIAAMAIMSRPGTGQWSQSLRRHVEDYITQHVAIDYHPAPGDQGLIHPRLGDIHFASVTPIDIASSQIRGMLAQGEPIEGLVPPTVAEYIQRRRLFHGR